MDEFEIGFELEGMEKAFEQLDAARKHMDRAMDEMREALESITELEGLEIRVAPSLVGRQTSGRSEGTSSRQNEM